MLFGQFEKYEIVDFQSRKCTFWGHLRLLFSVHTALNENP